MTGTPSTTLPGPSVPRPLLRSDTQPVQHLTSQGDYLTGDLTQERKAVLEDVKRYLQVPYATFVRSVLGSCDASQIRQKLTEAKILKVGPDRKAKWTGFAAVPAKFNDSEDLAFRPLGDIISNIFNQVRDCQLSYITKPFVRPNSERRNTSRPDANIIYRHPATDATHWFDIVIPFEFKKAGSRGAKCNNEQKIIWSLHEIMRADPLRRYALGITIENTDMRIWCSNRAFLAVSEAIDFMTDIDHVISFFYLISRKSREELGWDPTVERIKADGKFQYRFKVGNQIFTTTRPLATFGADAMVGRGTRVYEAHDEHGKTVVIKDSWRDKDREPEGKILENIFKDIRDKLGEKEATEAQKYLVGIRVYEDIIISGRSDQTFSFTEEGDNHLEWIDVQIDPILSDTRHLPSTGHIPESDRSLAEPMQHSVHLPVPCRVHTRTIFNEIGFPLKDETQLANCFVCLSGAQQALYCLHKAGWVHRDVSVANILRVKENGQWTGKLTDFEFAKKVTSEASHDVRTGTMHFLAVEVEYQSYKFTPRPATFLEWSDCPPFHMNFLHDLESLWWCAMWILFYHTDADSPTDSPVAQLKSFNEVFPHTIKQGPRYIFLTSFRDRQDAYRTLSATYRDECIAVICVADILQKYYEKAEKSYPIISLDDSLLEDVYKEVSDAHTDAMGKLGKSGITLQPVRQYLERKRAFDSGLSVVRQEKKARQA